jgi:hypothetical protein
MAQFDLNRSNDTPIATLKLNEIVPVNWHRYPPRVATTTLANENAAEPVLTSASGDFVGGVRGDDVDQSTAAVAITDASGRAASADYAPRTQAAKASMLGTTLAVDIGRARGWIEPDDPYPTGGATVPVAPVVSSIAPTTATAATLPLKVTITGTGFTPWSTVLTGGSNVPDSSGTYVSPTQMTVAIWKASAGTVSVAVEDHNLLSNTDKLFTVT